MQMAVFSFISDIQAGFSMTDRPRYRSWKKAYGGDPDTAVLHDLHKRATKLEQLVWALSEAISRLESRPQLVMASPVPINAVRDERIGGSEIPPPPRD